MKKFKKIFAVLMTLAMVLGMSMTTFAANSVDIPVKDAAEGTSFKHLQLIAPDTSAATGWKFTTPEIAANFKTALGVSDDQTAIWMLVKKTDATNTNIPATITEAASDDQVKNAITAVANAGYALVEGKTVSDAGVYYIRADKAGYAYNPMAAYVSFGYTNGEVSSLTTEGVTVKGSEISTTKTSDEANKVTEIGRRETYYVSSTIPFVPLGDDVRSYAVKDTITGAEYVVDNDNKVTLNVYYGKTVDEVKAGGLTPNATFTAEVTDTTKDSKDAQTFTADLSSVLAANTYANSPIVITYQAIVTDVVVGNDVSIGKADNDGNVDGSFGSNTENLYTAKITINKIDEKNPETKLAGAGFIISKTVDGNVQYATFDDNNKLSGWVTEESRAIEVFTAGEDGTLTVSGLDEGTYHITEKTAPDGYSIRDGIEDVVLTVDGTATAEISATKTVEDTTLASLPGTGGIGTTIFTIGGCAIMIIAAALFFASRRKAAK